MKKKLNKEENINKKSKETLKEFTKKQISTNILYHKIFLVMCLVINIGLFIFIIIYKNNLHKIESITEIYTKEYRKNNYFLEETRATIEHKIINLISINKRKDFCLSYSFLNQTEYDMVINFVVEFYKDQPHKYLKDIDKYKLKMIYQSSSDDINFIEIQNILNYHRNTLFIIETLENKKFGIFVDEAIIFNKENEFISKDNSMFIFSFQSKTMHKYIGNEPSLKINEKYFFEIGNKEIIINNYFYNNGGYINYPLKYFENLPENNNIFTEKNGKFDIKNIEIFSFYLDENKFY